MLTSSQHIELELQTDETLQVTQLSKSIPLYLLDKDNQLLEELPHIEQDDNLSGSQGNNKPGKSALVNDGQKIVVGTYLLRFVAGNSHNKCEPVKPREPTSPEDEQKVVMEPIFRMLTTLLDSLLKDDGQKGYIPELGLMTVTLVKLSEPKDDNRDFWEELKGALHSVRVARNLWIHPTSGTEADEIAFENILSLKRNLSIFKKHLFGTDFQTAHSEKIAELDQKIEETKKALTARITGAQ